MLEGHFTPSHRLLTIRGEAYPENVLSFYAPILEERRTAQRAIRFLHVKMHLTYYSSAIAKASHRLFK